MSQQPDLSSVGPFPPAEGGVRIAPILEVPLLSRQMGVDPARVMAEAGLDAALFEDPDNIIPFAAMGRFFAISASRTRCPHFGLILGQRVGLNALGLIGQLARYSADVGTALHSAILHMHLHDRGGVPSLWADGNRAILAYTIYRPDVPGTEHIYDGALAIGYNIVKTLAGPDWQPSELLLYRPRPDDVEPYRRFYRAPLRFSAEFNAVVFKASWLDHRLRGANILIHRWIMQEIETLEARGAGDLVTQLRRVLRSMLVGGACQKETGEERISRLFSIHRRTLNRRLRSHGLNFRNLVEEARFDIARQLLRDTRLPIAEIAAALDYSECSSFVRAFRRWSGTTPSAWRVDHVPQQPAGATKPDPPQMPWS
jgi:AraC-like DNA-binding protein